MLSAVRSQARALTTVAQAARRILTSTSSASSSVTHSSTAVRTTTLSTFPAPSSFTAHRTFAIQVIKVPHIADSISDATIAEINKNVGDAVELDEVIAKFDTDKVSIDFRSPFKAVVKQIHAKVGQTVLVGSDFLTVDTDAAAIAAAPASAAATKPAQMSTHPAGDPSALHGLSGKTNPVAQAGTQAPAHTHPTTVQHHAHDHNKRVPSISFRYGKRPASSSRPPVAQVAGSPVSAHEFQADNDRAFEAWATLPQRYKQKALSEKQMQLIDFGGAEPYEVKAKKRE